MDYKKLYQLRENHRKELLDVLDEHEKELLKTVFTAVKLKDSMYCKSFQYTDFRDYPSIWMEFFGLMEKLEEIGILNSWGSGVGRKNATYQFTDAYVSILDKMFNENV